MPGVCGLSCEVCAFLEHQQCICGSEIGCVAGTDPRAKDIQAKFTEKLGQPCRVLSCAIDRGVDYCFRCGDFPCDTHQGFLYHDSFLNWVKENKP